MKIIGVIPARYKSSRFPGKPLADIFGKPMVWWVYKQAKKVSYFDNVFVATDDKRIKKVCEELKMNALLTSSKHPTGTDRVGEVARRIKANIYVNIQGDEPLLSPRIIKTAILPLLQPRTGVCVTNLMTKIRRKSDLSDSTVPKVVINAKNDAVFLSRCPIPYPKGSKTYKYYKQVCVYGFKREALMKFCKLPRGIVELKEDIELLRFIENDIKVKMIEVDRDTVAVDTPRDLQMVKNILLKARR